MPEKTEKVISIIEEVSTKEKPFYIIIQI